LTKAADLLQFTPIDLRLVAFPLAPKPQIVALKQCRNGTLIAQAGQLGWWEAGILIWRATEDRVSNPSS
jgi:hypothetical protein